MQSEWHTMNWLSGSILWDFPLNHWADYIEKIRFAVWQNPQGNSHQHSKSIQWLSSIHCKSLFILIHFILHLKPRLNPNVLTSLSLCHPEFVLCFICLFIFAFSGEDNKYLFSFIFTFNTEFRVGNIFNDSERSLLCTPCLHLFDRKNL